MLRPPSNDRLQRTVRFAARRVDGFDSVDEREVLNAVPARAKRGEPFRPLVGDRYFGTFESIKDHGGSWADEFASVEIALVGDSDVVEQLTPIVAT